MLRDISETINIPSRKNSRTSLASLSERKTPTIEAKSRFLDYKQKIKKIRRSVEPPKVLQELELRNFIVEGAVEYPSFKDSLAKKDRPLILKQKYQELKKTVQLFEEDGINLRGCRYK